MHDALRDAAGLHNDRISDSEALPDAVFLYWNPCLGTPLIVIESPLLFFGIQIAAGLVALTGLLVLPVQPAVPCVGAVP